MGSIDGMTPYSLIGRANGTWPRDGAHADALHLPARRGSPQYYVPLAKAFSSDIKRIAVQYPGPRGTHDLASLTSIPPTSRMVFARCSRCWINPMGAVSFFGTAWVVWWLSRLPAGSNLMGNLIAAPFVSACGAFGRIGYDYIPESDRGLLNGERNDRCESGVHGERGIRGEDFAHTVGGSSLSRTTTVHLTRRCRAQSSLFLAMLTKSPPTRRCSRGRNARCRSSPHGFLPVITSI